MPVDPSTRLTIEHRAAQKAIGRKVVERVLDHWGVIDPRAVDRTWPAVARAISRAIEDGYTQSIVTAAEYVRAHALANGVNLSAVLTAPSLNPDQLETAIRVTGPVAVKTAASNGADAATAVATAGVQLAGASTRLVLLGGRRTIADTVKEAPEILGYRRVGIGGSCDFCSMLISRGAQYKDRASASVTSGGRSGSKQAPGSKFHDHCNCQPEPVYSDQAEPLDIAEHLARYQAAA